jgi:hypothetical protein
MTRNETHALLDSVLEANGAQDRYDIECNFYMNYDGKLAAEIRIHDLQLDKTVLAVYRKTDVVRMFIVSDYTMSVWDAVKEIAKFKAGAINDSET